MRLLMDINHSGMHLVCNSVTPDDDFASPLRTLRTMFGRDSFQLFIRSPHFPQSGDKLIGIAYYDSLCRKVYFALHIVHRILHGLQMGIARAILAECIGYRIRLHVCLDLGFHRGNLFVKVSNISAVGNQRIALIFQLFERRHPPLGKFPRIR